MSKWDSVSLVAALVLAALLSSCELLAPRHAGEQPGYAEPLRSGPPLTRVTVVPWRMTAEPVEGLDVVLAELDDTGFDSDPFFTPQAVIERFPGQGQSFTVNVRCLLTDEGGSVVDAEIIVSVHYRGIDSEGVAALSSGDGWSYQRTRRCSEAESNHILQGIVLAGLPDERFGASVIARAGYTEEERLAETYFAGRNPDTIRWFDDAEIELTRPRERGYTPPD